MNGKVKLGLGVGLGVGSSGSSDSDFDRARARSALEPFLFRKYLFFPRWLAMPDSFLLSSFARCDHANRFWRLRRDRGRGRGLGLGLYWGPSSEGGIIDPTREHILLPALYTTPYMLIFSKTLFSMRYEKQANMRAHNPAVTSGVMILLVKSVYHQDLKNWKALVHNRGIRG